MAALPFWFFFLKDVSQNMEKQLHMYTLEDEHGTYKFPIWKGKWSEPNLHGIMFQPFIFKGVDVGVSPTPLVHSV